jgi:hypothetical protein
MIGINLSSGWRRRRYSAAFSISGWPTTRSPRYTGGLSVEQIEEQHRPVKQAHRKGLSDLEGHRFRQPCRRLARLSGRGASILSWRASRPLQAGQEGADRPPASGHFEPAHNDHRPHDWPSTAAAAGYDIAAARLRNGVAVEINAHPRGLDLDWRWHQAALDCGCMMSINPDAHSIAGLDHMHWGVGMARKGGVPADRVLNAMTLSETLRIQSQTARVRAGGLTRHSGTPMDDLVLEGAVVAETTGGGQHFSKSLRDGTPWPRDSASKGMPRRAPTSGIDTFRAGLIQRMIRTDDGGPRFRCGVLAVVRAGGQVSAGDMARAGSGRAPAAAVGGIISVGIPRRHATERQPSGPRSFRCGSGLELTVAKSSQRAREGRRNQRAVYRDNLAELY